MGGDSGNRITGGDASDDHSWHDDHSDEILKITHLAIKFLTFFSVSVGFLGIMGMIIGRATGSQVAPQPMVRPPCEGLSLLGGGEF